MLCLAALLPAQSHKKQLREKRTGSFWREHTWIGGSVALGFSGNSYSSQFVFGLTPMIGYKIPKTPLSVGPRLGYTYINLKGTGSDNRIHHANLSSSTAAVFGRVKFLRILFLHLEDEMEWRRQAFADPFGRLVIGPDGEVLTERIRRNNIYAGLGYNQGGYELLLLYNFKTPQNTIEHPFSFRGGVTWNF